MSSQAPYLQRRGDTLFFRIAVPPDLRPLIGWREITKALRTSKKACAIPMALEYAAFAKRVFTELRTEMAASDEINPTEEQLQAVVSALEDDERHRERSSARLLEIVARARQKIGLDLLRDQHQDELIEQRKRHLRELEQVKLQAVNDALRGVLAGCQAPLVTTSLFSSDNAPTAPAAAPVATPAPVAAPVRSFEYVITDFLDKYKKRRTNRRCSKSISPCFRCFWKLWEINPLPRFDKQTSIFFF